ncbi:hypothetical protein ACS0TY_014302 [Phlomoides rotata]
MQLTPPSPPPLTPSQVATGSTLAASHRHSSSPVHGKMASSTAPTQDSNATPCFQSPVDCTPQTMSVDEIPTPNDSNQVNYMDESEETLVLGKKKGIDIGRVESFQETTD